VITWKPEDDIICLFDMDNTLFDYEGQMRADLAKIASPNDPDFSTINLWAEGDTNPWLEARMDLIKKQPGWWRDLPPICSGFDLLLMAQQIGFCCKILTKGPRRKSVAWMEKVDCIDKHFGPDMEVDLVSKSKRGVYGRVLVDDYGPYMDAWLETRPRGLGIMPAMPYNEDYCNPNVIRYTVDNKSEVEAAMRAAFKRAAHQHWHDLAGG